MSTQYGDADLTPPQGFARPEDPDGFTVAPAVIGGDLPGPPPPAETGPAHAGPAHAGPPDAPVPDHVEPPAKRSFLGKLLRRNG
ncbi:hypothetical protein [Saccharothrix variisporea]|uniref:hypothetical protein n=1 Tax=Saccharothrix variisporea TaxID=543527 RepID=UPI0011C461F1|nr:hypothetical protein [Saccharothrix variisporea]